MPFHNILVPVDGSAHALRAVGMAAAMAEESGGALIVLHAQREIPASLGKPNFERFAEHEREASEHILAPVRELLGRAGLGFAERAIPGPPAEVISETAATEGCDLIVMASRGKSDLEGLVVGSVTHRVLHTAPCPVLVVR